MITRSRKVVGIHPAVRTLEGTGFEVRRPIPTIALPTLGQFLLIDHIGPATIPPGSPGAPTHPHAGIETLSYFLEGGGRHLDSLGNAGEVGAGGAQWMRAGRGILHDERANAELAMHGGRMHMIQIWINLPRGLKASEPAYRHFQPSEIPRASLAGGNVSVHLLAGRLNGICGPLDTFATPWIAHAELTGNAEVSIPVVGISAGLYVMAGSVCLGKGQVATMGHLVTFDETANDISFAAGKDGAIVMVLASPALDAPIVRYGPFVAEDESAMRATIANYQNGKFGAVTPAATS